MYGKNDPVRQALADLIRGYPSQQWWKGKTMVDSDVLIVGEKIRIGPPDGSMPHLEMDPDTALDLAARLLKKAALLQRIIAETEIEKLEEKSCQPETSGRAMCRKSESGTGS